jgi:hypothetical protein
MKSQLLLLLFSVSCLSQWNGIYSTYPPAYPPSNGHSESTYTCDTTGSTDSSWGIIWTLKIDTIYGVGLNRQQYNIYDLWGTGEIRKSIYSTYDPNYKAGSYKDYIFKELRIVTVKRGFGTTDTGTQIIVPGSKSRAHEYILINSNFSFFLKTDGEQSRQKDLATYVGSTYYNLYAVAEGRTALPVRNKPVQYDKIRSSSGLTYDVMGRKINNVRNQILINKQGTHINLKRSLEWK